MGSQLITTYAMQAYNHGRTPQQPTQAAQRALSTQDNKAAVPPHAHMNQEAEEEEEEEDADPAVTSAEDLTRKRKVSMHASLVLSFLSFSLSCVYVLSNSPYPVCCLCLSISLHLLRSHPTLLPTLVRLQVRADPSSDESVGSAARLTRARRTGK